MVYGEDAVMKKAQDSSLPKLMLLVVGETARAEKLLFKWLWQNTNPKLSLGYFKLLAGQFMWYGNRGFGSPVCSQVYRVKNMRNVWPATVRGLLDIAQRAGYRGDLD